MLTPMHLHAIPAFVDNYLWTLVDGERAVVVDPGDAAPVQAFLEHEGLRLEAILVTHHHPDHVGGISALLERWPVPVYGPQAELPRIPQLTQTLADGDTVEVLNTQFSVIAVPGHTLGHIAYHAVARGFLLCGDTLFSAGCGRLFEGTPEQMHASLQRLAALPDDTLVYCTHEYTLSNLAFAAAVEPHNGDIQAHLQHVRALRDAGRPSLPTTLRLERTINPFLRAGVPQIRAAADEKAGTALGSEAEVFGVLRRWKDGFRAA
ncbi:hydroxyacylglutathione hydrolase [Sinimarinibacterium flocculans]|uniref:Hydroxyacylglutathione hydrolase n=2 Tax=Sinimarinibacterium flocculans TaxID=985250 RepID=A0A318EFG7_9GAMM|nr:hydroxyacylglutathione hydrolase [Sinimarinibacterium flocculans]